ncbi:hypothetical protein [Nonomuraea dietziae]|uniref:hypothetical protein n=1 Tax=Nonomuraea dietziae TaxID=65515 RepID=UPI0031E0D8A6
MSLTSLPLVEISGAPRERGRQYGEQTRELIERALAYYAEAFAHSSGLTWEQVTQRAGRWVAPSRAFAPELVEEMEGIAEGAGPLLPRHPGAQRARRDHLRQHVRLDGARRLHLLRPAARGVGRRPRLRGPELGLALRRRRHRHGPARGPAGQADGHHARRGGAGRACRGPTRRASRSTPTGSAAGSTTPWGCRRRSSGGACSTATTSTPRSRL